MCTSRRSGARSRALGLLSVVVAAGWLLAPSVAGAETSPTLKKNRGAIVFQSEPFAAWDSEESFAKVVAAARANKMLERQQDGSWGVHLMAFLKQPPGSKHVNLVWYRREGKRYAQVDFTKLVVSPAEVMLSAASTLTEAQGFKPGDVLEARITRLVGRKEIVYARCQLKLK